MIHSTNLQLRIPKAGGNAGTKQGYDGLVLLDRPTAGIYTAGKPFQFARIVTHRDNAIDRTMRLGACGG